MPCCLRLLAIRVAPSTSVMLSSSSPNDFRRETTALMAGPPKGFAGSATVLHDGHAQPPSHCARAGAKRFDEIVVDAGFEVDVIPNQGSGAAMLQIEARGASFRAAGSTRKPQKPVVRRLAIITSARTKRATLVSGRNTIGPHTGAMLSD